ncbi:phosphotransferase [Paenibacillus chitinolyticus]|uniref:phosphotransferase n=1 Tax=Paenibacillus chitinolyticus TaxID=79263 RepID=UPI0036570BD5
MSSILDVIEKLKLNVSSIEDVPESFSSDVYKLTLCSGENVYVKIPFNKDKLFREFQVLETLKGVIPVPKVLDIWYGDENTTGALLLSAIEGDPELYERCIHHFDGVFFALPNPDGPCIVHMDFRPGNILVNGNKVTGIIDFESARGGSSEMQYFIRPEKGSHHMQPLLQRHV